MTNEKIQVAENGKQWFIVRCDKGGYEFHIEPLSVSDKASAMKAAETAFDRLTDSEKNRLYEFYIMHAEIEEDGSIDEYRAETYSYHKYEVDIIIDPAGSRIKSAIDNIYAWDGYTESDYIRDCDDNADPEYCEMLHECEVELYEVEF